MEDLPSCYSSCQDGFSYGQGGVFDTCGFLSWEHAAVRDCASACTALDRTALEALHEAHGCGDQSDATRPFGVWVRKVGGWGGGALTQKDYK
jgi:hypothetical protein